MSYRTVPTVPCSGLCEAVSFRDLLGSSLCVAMARTVVMLICASCVADGLSGAILPRLSSYNVLQVTMRAAEPPKRPWKAIAAALCAGTLFGMPNGHQAQGGGSVIQRIIGERSAVARPGIARGINSKRLKMTFKSKLSKVPVYLVTNDAGSPFLSTLSGGDQSALLFLHPSDAQRMLAGVKRAPNAASVGPKVNCCSSPSP